jgi:hypothetical protein
VLLLAGLVLFAAARPRAACTPAAPGQLVDMALAHRLLPLTNLSALSTAALLDAHPGIAPPEARALVQLQQELYCRWGLGDEGSRGRRRETARGAAGLALHWAPAPLQRTLH